MLYSLLAELISIFYQPVKRVKKKNKKKKKKNERDEKMKSATH